jgi:hypothetical protein
VLLEYSMERRLLGIPVNPTYASEEEEEVMAPDRESDGLADERIPTEEERAR